MIFNCPRCKQKLKQYSSEFVCIFCLEKNNVGVKFGIDTVSKYIRGVFYNEGRAKYITICNSGVVIYELKQPIEKGLFCISTIFNIDCGYIVLDSFIIDETIYDQLCTFAEKIVKLQVFL